MMSFTDTSCTCSILCSMSRLDCSSVILSSISPCSLENEMQTEAIWASKWQTADSCFGLVGPHQRRLCLVALRQPRLTYSKANSNGQGRGNETTLAPSHGKMFVQSKPSKRQIAVSGWLALISMYIHCMSSVRRKLQSMHKKCFVTSS